MVSPYPDIDNSPAIYPFYLRYSVYQGLRKIYRISRTLWDIEKVVMAWKVIDDKNLKLNWASTSAIARERTDHSGVWKAKRKDNEYRQSGIMA